MSTTVAPPIPYAGYVKSNMISPAVPFVDGTGTIAPVNWRFLYSVFTAVNQLYVFVNDGFTQIENQITDLQNQINVVNTTLTSLQTQINTINSRLAAAGIP